MSTLIDEFGNDLNLTDPAGLVAACSGCEGWELIFSRRRTGICAAYPCADQEQGRWFEPLTPASDDDRDPVYSALWADPKVVHA